MENEPPSLKLPPPGDWTVEEPPADAPPEEPAPLARPSAPRSEFRAPSSDDSPPSLEQLVEALLFAGGPPLTPSAFASAVRVPAEAFHEAVVGLGRKYDRQRRPYAVRPHGDGFVLAIRPKFRGLKADLFGGPKEARLTQPALDVLSIVAYRQPVTKADVDAVRGADSGSVLRHLVRLGLIAVARRGAGGQPDVCYGTTPRFLTVFGLKTLDDLPQMGDTQPV